MNKDKAQGELLGKFWKWADKGDNAGEVQGALYWIAMFIEWLDNNGLEIRRKNEMSNRKRKMELQ